MGSRNTTQPLPLHALDDGALIVSVRIWTKKHRIPRFDTSAIHDSVHDGADVWYRPYLGDRILRGVTFKNDRTPLTANSLPLMAD